MVSVKTQRVTIHIGIYLRKKKWDRTSLTFAQVMVLVQGAERQNSQFRFVDQRPVLNFSLKGDIMAKKNLYNYTWSFDENCVGGIRITYTIHPFSIISELCQFILYRPLLSNEMNVYVPSGLHCECHETKARKQVNCEVRVGTLMSFSDNSRGRDGFFFCVHNYNYFLLAKCVEFTVLPDLGHIKN